MSQFYDSSLTVGLATEVLLALKMLKDEAAAPFYHSEMAYLLATEKRRGDMLVAQPDAADLSRRAAKERHAEHIRTTAPRPATPMPGICTCCG